MPRPLGVNPLLTITALAERAMIHLARARGWTFDDAVNQKLPEIAAVETAGRVVRPAGVMFTERMAGFVSASVLDDFEAAARAGEADNNALAFTGTIIIEDVARFEADAQHAGRIVGSLECPWLSPEPLV